MKIRQEQLDSFEESEYENFMHRLVETAFEGFPLVYWNRGEDEIRELAENALDRAPEYGLLSERSIALFFWFMLEHGANFDKECGWAKTILAEQIDEEWKCERLCDASEEALTVGEDVGHPMDWDVGPDPEDESLR